MEKDKGAPSGHDESIEGEARGFAHKIGNFFLLK